MRFSHQILALGLIAASAAAPATAGTHGADAPPPVTPVVTTWSGELDGRAVYRVRTMEGDELRVKVEAEGFEPLLMARNSARRGASVRSDEGTLVVKSGGFIEREISVQGGKGSYTLEVTRIPFHGDYEVEQIPFEAWLERANAEATGGVEAFASFIGPKMPDSFTDGACKLVPEGSDYCHVLSEYVGNSCFFIDLPQPDVDTGKATLGEIENVIRAKVNKNPRSTKEDYARKEYQTFYPGTIVREANYWARKRTARLRLWDNHQDQVTIQLKLCFDQ